MERVPGHQLCDVWPTMSEAQRFKLVKNVVEIEAKLGKAQFSSYGSLYYRNDHPQASLLGQLTKLNDSGDSSRFAIGPVTQRAFWDGEKQYLDINRGPCM
jgi:hypothetical protein